MTASVARFFLTLIGLSVIAAYDSRGQEKLPPGHPRIEIQHYCQTLLSGAAYRLAGVKANVFGQDAFKEELETRSNIGSPVLRQDEFSGDGSPLSYLKQAEKRLSETRPNQHEISALLQLHQLVRSKKALLTYAADYEGPRHLFAPLIESQVSLLLEAKRNRRFNAQAWLELGGLSELAHAWSDFEKQGWKIVPDFGFASPRKEDIKIDAKRKRVTITVEYLFSDVAAPITFARVVFELQSLKAALNSPVFSINLNNIIADMSPYRKIPYDSRRVRLINHLVAKLHKINEDRAFWYVLDLDSFVKAVRLYPTLIQEHPEFSSALANELIKLDQWSGRLADEFHDVMGGYGLSDETTKVLHKISLRQLLNEPSPR